MPKITNVTVGLQTPQPPREAVPSEWAEGSGNEDGRRMSSAPVYAQDGVTLYQADCLGVLRSLPDASISSVVTDPPYALKVDRRALDRFRAEVAPSTCSRCGRADVLMVAGYTTCAPCLAGLEAESMMSADMLGMQSQNWHAKATHSRGYADNDNAAFGRWSALWGSECLRVLRPGGHLVAFGGTRSWHRLACGLEDAGFELRDSLAWLYGTGFPKSLDVARAIGAGVADPGQSGEWAGWGTALKPGFEPIVLARKPLVGTVAETVGAFGTGALNLDGVRTNDRWPSNVMLDEGQARVLDAGSGSEVSRFFWVAKPGRAERVTVDGVAHPTVKPVALMRRLVRLVTPPGGCVLDPFAGSGTTVEACQIEGFPVVAVEREASFIPLIRYRMERLRDPVSALGLVEAGGGRDDEPAGLF